MTIKVTTKALQKVGKETAEKMSLQTTAETRRDGADVTWCDGTFQTRAAATGKARSPIVDYRVRRTIGDDDEAERRRRQGFEDRKNSSLSTYDGAVTCSRQTARLLR